MFRLAIFIIFLFASCSNDSEPAASCVVDAECSPGLICRELVCIAITQAECVVGRPTCPTGYECLSEKCSKIPGEIDAGLFDVSKTPDLTFSDMGNDDIPPTVVSFNPVDGATGIAVDIEIVIEFSEALQVPTVSKANISLLDASDNPVETTVKYVPGETTVTIKPIAPLTSATGYRISLNEFVRDIAFNQLAPVSASFITVFTEKPEIRLLAEKYAPTVYQSVGNLSAGLRNIDIPTTIEFDGNQDASDNAESALNPNKDSKASVYYNVITTETTLFIFYMLYYPIHKTNNAQNEHSLTGYVSVIDKATQKLLFAEGLKIQSSGTDSIISYKPDGSNIGVINPPPFMKSYPTANQEDDHYPLFITPGNHEPCNFFQEGPQLPIACRHNSGKFMGDDISKGIILRPGTAQDFSEATTHADGYREMTYGLVSFVDGIWSKRSFVGPTRLFSTRAAFKPAGMMRPGSADVGPTIVVPTRLSSDDIDNFGKLPFRWLPAPSQQNHGQWFLDPSFIFSTRYKRLPDGFSLDYCINPFFNIDRSEDPKCQ